MHQCTLIDLEQRKGKGKGSYYTVAKHVFVAEAAYYYVLWASVLLLASWNEQALSFFFGSLQSMRKTYTCYNYSNHELKPAAKRSCPSQPEPVQYSDHEKKRAAAISWWRWLSVSSDLLSCIPPVSTGPRSCALLFSPQKVTPVEWKQ